MSLRLNGVASPTSTGSSSEANVVPEPARASPILLTAILLMEQPHSAAAATTHPKRRGTIAWESTPPAPGSPRRRRGTEAMQGHGQHRVSVARKWAIAAVAGATMLVFLLLALPSRGRKLSHAFGVPYSVRDPQFARSISALVGPPIVPGNRIEPLQNGDEAFPAMLAAIAAAQQSITFESSYFRKGEMARRF